MGSSTSKTKSKRKGGRPRKKKAKKVSTGRKRVPLKNASMSTKRRRAEEIAHSIDYDVSLLELALKIAKKKKRIDKELEHVDSSQENIQFQRHDNDSALAFFLEYDFTKHGYNGLVSDSRSRGCPIYPCYDNIEKSKKECRPEKYSASETEIVVPLQTMLDKTAERLCNVVTNNWDENAFRDLEMSVSLGFDSSSGHLDPHQKSAESTDKVNSAQQTLFVTSMNILQIESCCNEIGENKLIWINPTPQSIRFTRPLRLSFEKETDAAIKKEHERLKAEITKLKRHRFKLGNNFVRVKYIVTESLFDGKCVNTLVGNNATSRCPMCLRTAHQFGNLNDSFAPNDSSLYFGLGLLHVEIKAFEHLLHLSYRKKIKLWDIRRNLLEDYNTRKLEIQESIYEKFGVKVDLVLQGHGTTNTGNLARRCFSDPSVFAECLEIDKVFVSKLATILLTFKSKKKINLEKLEVYCFETYNLHYKLYPWSRMNPSVHKLLRHGCQIARKFPLPIAFYSEDASESWHKLHRKNMREHARQTSRKDRLLDVFNRSVYLSDPKISLLLIEKRMKFHKSINPPQDVTQFYQVSRMIIEDDDDADQQDDNRKMEIDFEE